MALLEAHENYIIAATEHFIYDLPGDEKTLVGRINEFSRIFIEIFQLKPYENYRKKKAGEEPELYELYKCLACPDEFLRGLEQGIGEKFSYEEVIKFIYYYLMNKLLEHLASITQAIDYDTLPPKFFSAYELCGQYSDPDLFVTSRPRQEGGLGEYSWSWEDEIALKDRIYKPKFFFVPDENTASHVSLRFSVQVNAEKCLQKVCKEYKEIPRNMSPDDEDDFKDNTKAEALEHVREQAKKIVWDYIPHAEKDKIVLDLPGLDLITHSFYLDLIQQGKINIDDLCELTKAGIQLLTSNSITSLIQAGVCDFLGATTIQKHHHKLLEKPIYLEKVKAENSIISITSLSQTQCQTLGFPPILNLQAMGIISFDMAKSIDPLTRELLCKQTYLELVEQNKIPLRWLLSLPVAQKQILLQEKRITLITSGKATATEAINVADNIMEFAISDNILMKHNLFSLSQLSDMDSATLAFVESHPQLFHFLMRDNNAVSNEKLQFYMAKLNPIFMAINNVCSQHNNINILQEQSEYIEAIKNAMRGLTEITPLREHDINAIFKKELLHKIFCILQTCPQFANSHFKIHNCIKQTLTLEQKEKSLDNINQAWINAFDKAMGLLPQQRVTRPAKLFVTPAALTAGSGFFDVALRKLVVQKIALITSLAAELNNFNREEPVAKRRRI